MAGDSEDNDLLEEEDDEDDTVPITPQDLQRLGAQARQQRLAQGSGADAFSEGDAFQEEDGPAQFYPRSASPPPLAPLPPEPLARRRQDPPFTPPPRHRFGSDMSAPRTGGGVVLTGWQSLRMHSHWLIPVTLVALFFFLVLFTHPQQAGPMIFIFAAIGLIQAALLLYSPNDTFWVVVVAGGFVVFVSVTFFVLFLPIFALILSILLLSLGGVALRERYFPVKEGTVAVMGYFGRYNRTLQPGFNLRIPGEKVLGIVETQSIRYDARIPPLILVSGEQVLLSVAITYQVVPGEEHLAIRLTKDWQKAIQQQLQAAVHDEISLLSIQDFRQSGRAAFPAGTYGGAAGDEVEEDQEMSPLERINERLTRVLRQKVADRGVTVREVKVHLLDSPHLPGSQPVALQQASPGHLQQPPVPHPTVALPMMPQTQGQVVEGSVQSLAPDDLRVYPGAPLGMTSQPVSPVQPTPQPPAPSLARGGVIPASPPESLPLMSPQALAEAYDAVLHQRITDLGTIQRVISQFEAVAADPELSEQAEFDVEKAAHNLRQHVYYLQTRQAAQPGQQPNDNPLGASDEPTLPLRPRDQ